jgi:hypothetical protein
MGMTCSLHRVSSAEIDALIRNPDDVSRVLGLDDGPRVREVRPKGILGFLLRLTPITISEVDPDAPDNVTHAADPEKSIDIEKAWHGLHFLFTGTADEGTEPACYIVKGGEDLDDEGFGRALRPAQVRDFAGFLTSLTAADLERRYEANRMTALGIYPDTIWNRRSPDDDSLQWLLDSFQELRAFVKRAADAGDGLVVHIS